MVMIKGSVSPQGYCKPKLSTEQEKEIHHKISILSSRWYKIERIGHREYWGALIPKGGTQKEIKEEVEKLYWQLREHDYSGDYEQYSREQEQAREEQRLNPCFRTWADVVAWARTNKGRSVTRINNADNSSIYQYRALPVK